METELRSLIDKVLQSLGIDAADFSVEHPNDLSYGDYATNVAMVAAKKENKSPLKVAEAICKYIEANKPTAIEKIEIAGPGFINFYLSRNFFGEKIADILKEKDTWGTNRTWAGKKVIVEYTDPNPFKEFHVGHLFTNAVGESIARLFINAGADTKRVNYQGDVGLHVACALYGMQELGFTGERDFTARELGKAYALGACAHKENPEAAEKIKEINKLIYEKSDNVINKLYDKGRDVSLKHFESIYDILGTSFDSYFFESEAALKGKELVLENLDIFEKSEGALIFKGEKHGLHTRVFLNAEGLPTYEAKELALAKMKEDALGNYDLSIIATSNEIREYFKVLKKAMSFVYPDLEAKTEHIGHGTVRLPSGKMSSRTGEVIPALDFINEIESAVKAKASESDSSIDETLAKDIAIGAIKYATLKSNILQDSVFEKEQALSFEGDSGPYLQYTHARINSVLAKATDVGVQSSTEHAPGTPYEVERILYQFPEVAERALTLREPHLVVGYLTELAGAFNTLYGKEKIADASDEFSPYKLVLAEATKITLKNGLWLLGIKAPERM